MNPRFWCMRFVLSKSPRCLDVKDTIKQNTISSSLINSSKVTVFHPICHGVTFHFVQITLSLTLDRCLISFQEPTTLLRRYPINPTVISDSQKTLRTAEIFSEHFIKTQISSLCPGQSLFHAVCQYDGQQWDRPCVQRGRPSWWWRVCQCADGYHHRRDAQQAAEGVSRG